MLQLTGNLWDQSGWKVITTNGTVTESGRAVMGKGIALEAATRHPELPRWLGQCLMEKGNHVFVFPEIEIITFPVKNHWKNSADVLIISRSCQELKSKVEDMGISTVYMVRPGCGAGGLNWANVGLLVERMLSDNRFVIVEMRP